jgi:2-polyprenyl-3-methyl-5-hydroxy-6-metoxy-1,4-benzoquinol methylase
MNLRVRSTAKELMDAPGLDGAVYARCLTDLASVNRVTATHRATLRWLSEATAKLPAGTAFSVLDIAFGQGDLLRAIAGWAAARGLRVKLAGIDMNPRSAYAARSATPPGMAISYLTGDIFRFEPVEVFDFIVTSQFTHHLSDVAVVRLLHWMEAHAARGWYVSDLHRHAIAYYGFRWLARLFGWHEIVRHDGTVSIARGFTRKEWLALLAKAGVSARVRWHWLFRHGVSRIK